MERIPCSVLYIVNSVDFFWRENGGFLAGNVFIFLACSRVKVEGRVIWSSGHGGLYFVTSQPEIGCVLFSLLAKDLTII